MVYPLFSSVKEITVEDEYLIEIEAEYKTHVPLPVVVIEPKAVDLAPYEDGSKDTMVFRVTNYGLVEGNETTLNFPTNHPTLTFEVVGGLQRGTIEPQSTDVVVVKVKSKSARKKRSCYSYSGSATVTASVSTLCSTRLNGQLLSSHFFRLPIRRTNLM